LLPQEEREARGDFLRSSKSTPCFSLPTALHTLYATSVPEIPANREVGVQLDGKNLHHPEKVCRCIKFAFNLTAKICITRKKFADTRTSAKKKERWGRKYAHVYPTIQITRI
jgi:hypothetical protein